MRDARSAAVPVPAGRAQSDFFVLTFQPDSFSFPSFQTETILGDRLVVGLKTLDLATKVRILVPQPRSHRLAVRTLASHAGNSGSIPGGTTKLEIIKELT